MWKTFMLGLITLTHLSHISPGHCSQPVVQCRLEANKIIVSDLLSNITAMFLSVSLQRKSGLVCPDAQVWLCNICVNLMITILILLFILQVHWLDSLSLNQYNLKRYRCFSCCYAAISTMEIHSHAASTSPGSWGRLWWTLRPLKMHDIL